MIDPKELHIGSHVMVNGVRAEVIRIDEPVGDEYPQCTMLRLKAIIDMTRRTCACPANSDKIEPIPITAELLTELGFEKSEDNIRRKIFTPNQWIYICRDNDKDYYNARIHSDINMNTSFRCKYLHELEAFLYLTSKTELIKD